MAKVELKRPIVEEISANLEGAAGVVLVDHCGLTVEQDTQLRRQMRAEGIIYKVYKNTMLNFAIKGTEYEPLAQHLEGPSAVAISKTDATAPARIIANFAKTADKLEIKAGVVEGNYYDAKGMTAIASIPSREVLLGRLLGSMNSPVASFARVVKTDRREQRGIRTARPYRQERHPAQRGREIRERSYDYYNWR